MACTLNATGQSRVTLPLRYENLRAACGLRQEERGTKNRSKTIFSQDKSSSSERVVQVLCHEGAAGVAEARDEGLTALGTVMVILQALPLALAGGALVLREYRFGRISARFSLLP